MLSYVKCRYLMRCIVHLSHYIRLSCPRYETLTLHAEVWKNFTDDVFHLFLQGTCIIIEGQHRRNDNTNVRSGRGHIAQVNTGQRCIPGNKNNASVFFQAYAGGPDKEICLL